MSSQATDSQWANASMNSTPAKSPLRPIQPNEIMDLPSSQGSQKEDATDNPVFGKPSKLHSLLYRKEKSIFNPNKKRPEHHRPRQIVGPSAPTHQDIKPAAQAMYNSIPSAQEDGTNPAYPLSTYGQSGTAYANVEIYTDPTKASADLKALLEGGMEDEDEEKEREGGLEDGVLKGIKVKLLPHQVEGVEWMKGRELGPVKKGKVPKGGILADDMGLGKTLQSISLILSNPKPRHDEPGWKPLYDKVEKSTLVVAPLALIRQWEAEIKEKVSKDHRLTVCVHHGPGRTKRFQDLARYDVVITTYQILVSEHGHSNDSVKAGCFGLHWYRVILDEAHTIKNRNAKSTKACYALQTEFRWCLTGTPMQNNLDELQSLVAFLRIPPYDNLAEWRAHIDAPMKNGKGHIAIRRLHSILRCFMKRRTKDILKEEGALNPGGKKALEAAAKKGEAAAAPAFKITERNIVSIAAEFSPAERKFYDRLQARADKSLEKMMKGKVNYANALVLLLRLRQACNHPKLVGGKLEKDKDALSTDTAQKSSDADVDALADALGAIGLEAKQCDSCLNDLSRKEVAAGQVTCSECAADQVEFNQDTPAKKRSKKKKSKKSVVKEQVKIEVQKRKPRNRRAVIDSDDEEDEASWIVPEDERGSLRLGKAGGEEDENAEGGGEWINSDDSTHHSEDEDGSRLDSFIVDDENSKAEVDLLASGDDESFVSISKIRSRVVKVSQEEWSPSADDSGTGSDSDEDDSVLTASETDSDSDDHGQKAYQSRGGNKKTKKPGHLLASAKIREMMQVLRKEAHEHKFIVFSQFTSMLDLAEPFLRKEGLRFVRYDGSMKNDAREEALRSLRSDPRTRVLLCSLKCGSLGLNLTAATRVVILEPFWNPFVEEQAIDRVHRLTQTVDVTVYKLTVANTVEERILELQNKKRLLAEATIEGGMRKKKDALKLGLKEILELFRHDARAYDGAGADAEAASQFGSAAVVRQDVGGMISGIAGPRKGVGGGGAGARTASQGRDPAYDRRW